MSKFPPDLSDPESEKKFSAAYGVVKNVTEDTEALPVTPASVKLKQQRYTNYS